ncbi:uncharacterized protein LOC120764858 isoform X3 [Hirundo rustica]|uniref:uncharacterized protein LOC120764858 isoform X3 n=1 Tax=Hirundo rustica TaxID=43150 RepID=UPI0026726A4D|nr:uncharacterized protein LOC120764858 isoform X3 [Hirundo rustica]
MGARLSVSQKIVYYQILGALDDRKTHCQKKQLKKLIWYLFSQFPDVSFDQISSPEFWEAVAKKLSQSSSCNDKEKANFALWSLQILFAMQKQNEKKKKTVPCGFSPVSSVSPYPDPKIPSPKLDIPQETPKLSPKLPSSPVCKPRVQFTFAGSSSAQNPHLSESQASLSSEGGSQDGGDSFVQNGQSHVLSSHEEPLSLSVLPSRNPFCNPFLSLDPSFPSVPPLALPSPLTLPPSLKPPPSDSAPCDSSLQPLPAPGSHGFPAHSPSSHAHEGGEGGGVENPEARSDPGFSATPVTYRWSKRGGVLSTVTGTPSPNK